MKNFLKLLKKERKSIIIVMISLLALIIGSLVIDFIPSLLIILVIDFLIFFFTKKKVKTSPKEKLQLILFVCFCCFILLVVLAIGFFAYIAISAPSFTQEKLYNKEASIIYDKDNNEITKLGTEERRTITYDQMSESLIDAIIATEDSRFFQHSGVDIPRFLKASIGQLLGKNSGGASTITMQVSKNAFTSTEDKGLSGIIRKFTDIYVSVFKIETHYTKEQILEFYVNSNLMGGHIYGVEQASLAYFGKHASELNIAESAMIAGLFQAPNAYNPYLYPDACEQRRQVVLSLMLRHGYITEQEYNIAKQLTVKKLLNSTTDTVSNEYQTFIDTVVAEVIDRTGNDPYSVSMKIYTTLDPTIQKAADDVMNGVTYTWKNNVVEAGTAVVDVSDGSIRAVGGGQNRSAGDWNYATMNKRQIGSTAKPLFDYGPGIEYNNWSTADVFSDEPYSYSDGVSIRDWDSSYFGYTDMHDALKYSRNIPAVKAFQRNTNSNIKTFVTNLGLSPEIVNGVLYETHAIGGYIGESPLTVAAAYAAFSNGGYYHEPHSFTKIIYTDTGKEYTVKPITRRAMSEATAYMITTILQDTASYAVGLSVNGVNFCAKTGTTDLSSADKKAHGLSSSAISDKWLATYNDKYSIATWYGYAELNKEHYLTSADTSIKYIFQAIAKSAYTEKSTWNMPASVVKIDVEDQLDTPLLPSQYTPSDLIKSAYFKKGFEPTEVSERFSQLANVTNLDYSDSKGQLSWTAISTPKFISTDYLNTMAANIFTTDEYRSKFVNTRISYNNSYIGSVVYKIYKKDASGNLTLLGTTSSNSYNCKASGNTTFVVKASYSIFTANMSSGTEINVTGSSTIITSELNSESTVNVKANTTYIEPTKPIIVWKNGTTDITNEATISIVSIKNKNTNETYTSASSIDTSTIGNTYTITYKITCQDYTDTLTKTIVIVE